MATKACLARKDRRLSRAASGLLPCRHVGGLLRFEAEAIREYAHTGKVPNPVSNTSIEWDSPPIPRTAAQKSVKPPAPSPPPAFGQS
jgi:hypothetical protein